MEVREVQWPREVGAIARSLARSDAWFWLDGSAGETDGGASLSYLGQATEVLTATPGHEREFLERLREGVPEAANGLGFVAAFGYEFGVALMGERPADDDAAPAFALRADVVLVLDHERQVAELRSGTARAIEEWLARHGEHLIASSLPQEATPEQATPEQATPQQATPRTEQWPKMSHADVSASFAHAWNRSDEEYLQNVETCRTAIREGDAYVLCLTDTVSVPLTSVDPLSLYESLRDTGATTRGAVLVAGSRALVSLSPERFLSKRGHTISTHPVKGTRPRGTTAPHDAALADELAADPKERAENLMIVDLMRNDFSRVCVPGSVQTAGFLRVETHPRVHHLVSTVQGQLVPGFDIFDAIEACFPGGSMTGAPKRSAVRILSEVEGAPRGLYSGCFGWISHRADAELAMTIRSIEIRGLGEAGARALVGAGGGVTIDSEPAAELAEKRLKAAALLSALTPYTEVACE